MINLKKIFSATLSFVLLFSFSTSPIVYAADGQNLRSQVNFMAKDVGLNQQDQSIKEFFEKSKAYVHPEFAQKMQPFVDRFGHERMPKIEFAPGLQQKNKESIKILISAAGQSIAGDIIAENGETHLYFDKKRYSYEQLYVADFSASNLTANFLSAEELEYLLLAQPGLAKFYLQKLQNLAVALEEAQPALSDVTYPKSSSLWSILLNTAHAANEGQACIIAGNPSLVKNGVCSLGEKELRGYDAENKSYNCPARSAQCNPVLFGLTPSGKPHCSPLTDPKNITATCRKNSNLEMQDAKKLAELITKNPQYYASIDAFQGSFAHLMTEHQKTCLGEGTPIPKDLKAGEKLFTKKFPVKKHKGKDLNEHHRIACLNVFLQYQQVQRAVNELASSKLDKPSQGNKIQSESLKQISHSSEKEAKPQEPKKIFTKTYKKDERFWPIMAWMGGMVAMCVFWICKDNKKNSQPLPPMPNINLTVPSSTSSPSGSYVR